MDQLSLGSLGLGGGPPAPSRGGGGPGGDGGDLLVLAAAPPQQNTPQLVHRSGHTAIYRLYDTGFKVVLHPNPGEELILKLLHEQNISQFLPWSCRKRQVTDVTTFDKRPALSFKWANGITLTEWLQKVQFGPAVDLTIRIRAAMAIARTLSDFHEGGVVYNNLTPENVVLSPFEGEYVATLIDLSNSLIYRNDNSADEVDATFERQMKEVDLKALGVIFGAIFQGADAGGLAGPQVTSSGGVGVGGPQQGMYGGGEEYPDDGRRKRGKPQARGEGLPLYLGSLISALLESKPDVSYSSAKDVFNDLKALAEDGPGGQLLRTDLDESTSKSRLRLQKDMFYGRQVQMSMLMHLFQSSVAVGHQPLMATISGYPGTG